MNIHLEKNKKSIMRSKNFDQQQKGEVGVGVLIFHRYTIKAFWKIVKHYIHQVWYF